MASVWTEKPDKPNDKERKRAKETGTGDYGGNDVGQTRLIVKTLPT